MPADFIPGDEWVTVDSTCLSRVRYNADRESITVEYRQSGKLYTYSPCDPQVFFDLLESPSIGLFVNDVLKRRFFAREGG